MSLGLYIHADSFIHRLPAGIKVMSLVGTGTAIFLVSDWRLLVLSLAAVVLLYVPARVPWHTIFPQMRSAIWLLILIFVVQVLIDTWMTGLIVILRFATLILLASLVTLTTRVSDMIEALETGLQPLTRVGVNPEKISLALSMAIRFIPVISEITSEVRNAQRVRGLDRSIIAIAVPVIVRTLKMADDIADAIEARSYASRPKPPVVTRSLRESDAPSQITLLSMIFRLQEIKKLSYSRNNTTSNPAVPFVPLSASDRPLGGKIGAVLLGTLVLAVASWIEVPMAPVPMTLQTYAVLIIGALYGWRFGFATVLTYLAGAAIGLPVLSGGDGGPAHLVGPTAGYLIGFMATAILVGWMAERGWTAAGITQSFFVMVLGHAVTLGLGVIWLATLIGWSRAVTAGLTPFLLGAIVKSALAVATIEIIRRTWAPRTVAERS